MVKSKHLGMIAMLSGTFLFSGCVQYQDTFPNEHGYYNNNVTPSIHVSLSSYAYPYYYNRPYYFLNGLYYYGGHYSNGFYHYGTRRFGHGHYYNNGNRYYKGRQYRARNGVHGYYKNRNYYKRSHRSNTRQSNVDRGREYNRQNNTMRARPNQNARYYNKRSNTVRARPRQTVRQNTRSDVRSRNNYQPKRSYVGSRSRQNSGSGVRRRSRPVR